ncbi:MAG: hypothetical protein ABMA64_01445 [Myxococcota bacterium]
MVWLWGSGCSGDDPVESATFDADRPMLVCPGDAGCADNAGELRAGAAERSIVPTCWEAWGDVDGDATWDPVAEDFFDCGCDRLCPGDPGYAAADEGEGDGEFQASWIAGFQNSRPANGVRDASLGLQGEGDGLWATALVLDQGAVRVAVVALDAFGVMIDDTRAIREAADAAGLDVDYLVVHSSHTHAAPDTLGIYGPDVATTGYDPRYAAQVRDTVIDALTEAVGALEPVSVAVGEVDADTYHPDGVGNLIWDTRDPVIVDSRIGAARFARADGSTVATVVHFSNHPEETADVWALFTANFVHALRRTVSDGVDWGQGARPGLGGVTMYWNGTVGGMMTSLGARVEDPTGAVPEARTFEKADTLGRLLGEMALDAVEAASPIEPALAARRDELLLPVDNNGFQAMFLMGTIGSRQIYDFDPSAPVTADNTPFVQSEVGLVEVGPWRILCLPGEWFPELLIGGYDGAHTPPNQVLVDPENVNPPDLALAATGPTVGDQLGGSPGWALGLANDQIGYVIPPEQFEVGAVPYLLEAEGDHYEETNSLGRQTAPLLVEAVTALLGWSG